jgi:hypothetical protein
MGWVWNAFRPAGSGLNAFVSEEKFNGTISFQGLIGGKSKAKSDQEGL